MRPTYAEIRLRALVHNYKLLEANVRAHAGTGLTPPGLVAVIKANAYGHGVGLCGPTLAQAGAGWLGVTTVEEALALQDSLQAAADRLAGGPRVLVMSGVFPGEEAVVVEQGLTAQVWEPWHLRLLQDAAARAGRAPASVGVHLEIDTGMSRQGVAPGEPLAKLLREMGGGSPLSVEGVLTHFSSPQEPQVLAGQVDRLRLALQQLWAAGVRPRWVHAGNSANVCTGTGLPSLALLAREFEAELLVRPGLALYGVPFGEAVEASAAQPGAPEAARLEPVLRWKTQVISVREVAAGTPVGYAETFRAPEGGARLALLPVGYADGFARDLSERGFVLVRGCRVPVAGRISMDQTVVDVSRVAGVAVGDEVVLLGQQGPEEIPVGEMAAWRGTIPYEVLCGIGARVPRVPV